jgi:hypothetical protein
MIYAEPNLAWKIVAQGDYNGDGKADLLWRNDTSGQVYMMLMNGFTISSQAMVYTEPNTAWRVLGPWEYGQGTGILLASLGAKGMASTFQGTPLNPGRIEGTLVNPSPGISGHPVNQTPDMERTSNLQ